MKLIDIPKCWSLCDPKDENMIFLILLSSIFCSKLKPTISAKEPFFKIWIPYKGCLPLRPQVSSERKNPRDCFIPELTISQCLAFI